jgi:hypothetical protein
LLERIAARAGVDLTPAAVWLLGRYATEPDLDVDALAKQYNIDLTRLRDGAATLHARGLVTPDGLTPEGEQVLERLITARRDNLLEILKSFSPERHAELTTFITNVARHVTDASPR